MEFVIGTLPLLLVLTLILACVRKWATRELTIKEVGIVDWCMIGGLCLRTLWAIIVIVLSDKYSLFYTSFMINMNICNMLYFLNGIYNFL